MNNKSALTAALVAVFIASASQIPSSAQANRAFRSAVGMTDAQIKAIGTAVNDSFAAAMDTAKTTGTTSTTTNTATVSASGTYPCASGGYIKTVYSMVMVAIRATGKVTITGGGKQTIVGWKCVKGWLVNGNPYISHTLSGTRTGNNTSMKGGMGGGWTAIGPNKMKQVCQFRGDTQYQSNGTNGVTSIRIACKPGGTTNITERF